MLWSLFVSFLKIGCISFGGGYAMIPVMENEIQKQGWLTAQQFTDAITIAGMSPGPIATNCAVFVGYKIAGILGAITSLFAISLPSLLLILLIALFFRKIQDKPIVQSASYGLRPVITGFIGYAAIRFAIQNHLVGGEHWFDGRGLLVMFAALAVLLLTNIHPVLVILFSGVLGIVVYH
jgi:chromate transporter